MYKYSVIIPHYNIPELLQRCLDSIPERDDVQVIVVDDNSDSSKVDFEKFPGLKRPNTEVYFTKEGRGAGYARNVGLKHAKGEWILFADADDRFYQSNLEQFFDSGINLDGYDVVVWNFSSKELNEDGSRLEGEKGLKLWECRDLVQIYNRYLPPWAKMVRRSLLEAKNIQFEEVRFANDMRFSVLLAINISHYAHLDQCIYDYEVREGSLKHIQSLSNYRCRLNVALSASKLLLPFNMPINPNSWQLENICRYSYFQFLYYVLKEWHILGKKYAMADYNAVCEIIGMNPNPIVCLVDKMRVNFGALVRKPLK